MAKIIPFDEAIDKSSEHGRSLIIGNGFSIKYFSYKNLLETADLKDTDPVRTLFKSLDTYDFESVIHALEDAAIVELAYGNKKHSDTFEADANRLRESLVHAIRKTHPAHRENIEDVIESCGYFLKQFGTVFTLNYDLLLYWVILEDTNSFKDGFGLGTEENGFRGPFVESAYCNIYNLHGGLHLFRTATGEIEKRLAGSSGVIDAIAETITKAKRLPIYVAEGTSIKKMLKINSVPYLRHCYETLRTNSTNLFMYGHSGATNDAHIYQAIFSSASKVKHLYFCVHQPTAKMEEIDGELARYKKLYSSGLEYSFVDSASAQVWDRKLPAKP